MADTTLIELVTAVDSERPSLQATTTGDPAAMVSGVTLDSRNVQPGDLFVCTRGESFDGHNFAASAIASGASALMVDHELGMGVPEVIVEDTREWVGWFASALHGFPSRHLSVVGITGTNGKTTSAHLLNSILESAGHNTSTIGTLSGARTTPESTELQRQLADRVDHDADSVVMEVSSHALALHRVDGTWFEVAAFTNITLDHLDFHGDFDSYFEAKASLFTPDRCAIAVIDVSSPMGRRLADLVATDVVAVDLDMATGVTITPDGSSFTFEGRSYYVPLAGRFNIANSLVVMRCAELLGLDADTIATGLRNVGSVPGRVEPVAAGQPFSVLVDYAHTPDGLQKVLEVAGDVAEGKVIAVFGCGGDRDRAKRPQMGSVAADAAEVVIVTSDNPRSEDPETIIDQIVAGISDDFDGLSREVDRRTAITAAIGHAVTGDVVVIAGKGHETTQTTGDSIIDFDDRVVAREALTALGWNDQ